ncbi:hypothetical protein AN958_12909 [Leucoagaricus sp. SymC.cos]|nr:hypothetical protein AN958_12909 [Leucoagaricus sp. SymC.cos]
MRVVIHRDVWREIMSYFTISLEDDAADEIKTKWRALLSLALTRSDMSHIALDGIWKSMMTLEPLVSILNGKPTTGPSAGPVLSYSTNNSGFWQLELSSSSIPDQRLTRVKSYLSRIHRLYFSDFPPAKEYTLWQALSSLGFPNPLCPGLQELFLNPNTSTMAYHLIPLISPTLRALILFDPSAIRQGEIVSLALLDLM